MKKKLFFVLGVLLILVISFFAGEPVPKKEARDPEHISEERVVTSEAESWEEKLSEKEEEAVEEKSREEKTEETSEEAPSVEISHSEDAEPKNICTLSVRCDDVLSNMDKLAAGKETIIPENGILYPETKIEFTEGESVFDVLYRVLREEKIHFEYVNTPMYNSVYIEGIGNLYEFDCGDMSGWVYRVNGVKPNVGCSQYQVRSGDVITISYTCNFMKER